jgi:hypothetical protein
MVHGKPAGKRGTGRNATEGQGAGNEAIIDEKGRWLMILDAWVDDFAVRSFRDIADANYIAARMACRAALVTPFLWASQQAVEKYLKCILLLNRICAREVRHDLGRALSYIERSDKVALDLPVQSREDQRKPLRGVRSSASYQTQGAAQPVSAGAVLLPGDSIRTGRGLG